MIADALFTAGAVIAQPMSGALLAWAMGYSLCESWIVASLVLYVLVGLCWLPVVVDPDRAARPRARRGRAAGGASAALLPALFRVWFCARLAGFHRRDRDFRADDLEAALVVTKCLW